MGTATPVKRQYTSDEKFALIMAFKKSYPTIMKWIRDGDDRLTSDRAKKALANAKSKK